MTKSYSDFYNNLVNLSRNKDLYKDFISSDDFADRLNYFLIHFAFFFKNFKKNEDKVLLQEIYDFTFKQLELSIREIGYGDQSINKKMKDYLNLFHSMIDKFHFWEEYNENTKIDVLSKFVTKSQNMSFLLRYFESYLSLLKKNTLNSYLKSVINR